MNLYLYNICDIKEDPDFTNLSFIDRLKESALKKTVVKALLIIINYIFFLLFIQWRREHLPTVPVLFLNNCFKNSLF